MYPCTPPDPPVPEQRPAPLPASPPRTLSVTGRCPGPLMICRTPQPSHSKPLRKVGGRPNGCHLTWLSVWGIIAASENCREPFVAGRTVLCQTVVGRSPPGFRPDPGSRRSSKIREGEMTRATDEYAAWSSRERRVSAVGSREGLLQVCPMRTIQKAAEPITPHRPLCRSARKGSRCYRVGRRVIP